MTKRTVVQRDSSCAAHQRAVVSKLESARGFAKPRPHGHASLPCGQLDFESGVIAHSEKLKPKFQSS